MESDFLFSPGWILLLGGLAMTLLPQLARHALIFALPAATLTYMWMLAPYGIASTPLAGYELITVYIHPTSRIFATAFAIAALGGGAFAMTADRKLETAMGYIYAGAAIGACFAGDFLTLFLFWEIMAIASTLVIWSNRTTGARNAGMRYALMHCFGGVVLLAGIAAQIHASGTSALPAFALTDLNWSAILHGTEIGVSQTGIWLILTGIMVNLAAPPFSAWLSDAYPESSPSGMVYLSAFTTKVAIFVLLTLFAGVDLLLPIGLFMIFYGMVYGLLENNIRRLLAFAIINQTGFMMVGVGIGSELALQGVAAHAFACVVYIALLVMTAGTVIETTGKHRFSDLGGLFRSMPVTASCAVIAALAMAASPFTSGFVSKTLILAAAAEAGLRMTWFALLAGSAGVLLHAGLKFPWFIFFGKDSGLRPNDAPENSQLVMVGFATLCVIPALAPTTVLYSMLPGSVAYNANTTAHALAQLQLLGFAALGFFLCLPSLKRTPTLTLTFDWFYRRPARSALILLERGLAAGYTGFLKRALQQLRRVGGGISRLTGPKGVFAETKTLAGTTLIVAILLATYLLLYLSR